MVKNEVLNACYQVLDERINRYQDQIAAITEAISQTDSGRNEDDDEGTGALMNELETTARYLKESTDLKSSFSNLPKEKCTSICHGALITTDSNIFYISHSLGQINVNGTSVYCISRQAPLYDFMKNKVVNEVFVYNDRSYKIIAIV